MAKIATAAAVNVPGVVRQSGGLTRLTGRDLPRADISMGSDAVAINLFLAVSWPCSVTELTGRVRTEVGRSVESLTGLPLHDMNVMIAATEGSDDSCVSGVEIAEGPAQQALSDPIPPRVPSANPAAAVSAVVIACGPTRTRLRRLARMVHQPWNFRIGTLDPKLRGVDVSSALATVATSGGDRCRCRGCCPDNVGDQTPCENPCPTREPERIDGVDAAD